MGVARQACRISTTRGRIGYKAKLKSRQKFVYLVISFYKTRKIGMANRRAKFAIKTNIIIQLARICRENCGIL